MATTYDQALDRVRKLLAKAGNNPESTEAQTALALAQRLMDEFRIERATAEVVTPDTDAVADGHLHTTNGDFLPKWEGMLASIVAKVNCCRAYVTHGRDPKTGKNRRVLNIIGRPSDAAVARYVFQYVHRAVLTAWAAYAAPRGLTADQKARFAFMYGAADRVTDRMYLTWTREQARHVAAAKAELAASGASATGTALARIDHTRDAVESLAESLRLRSVKPARSAYDAEHAARAAGAAAGDAIRLDNDARGLGAGVGRLAADGAAS